jgi:hypothetical protein
MSILRRIPLRKVNLTLLFNVFSIVLLDVHAHPFFFFFFFFLGLLVLLVYAILEGSNLCS